MVQKSFPFTGLFCLIFSLKEVLKEQNRVTLYTHFESSQKATNPPEFLHNSLPFGFLYSGGEWNQNTNIAILFTINPPVMLCKSSG